MIEAPYADDIYSPRAAAVYTQTDKDTWKFIFSRSSRPGFAKRIRDYHHDHGTYADPVSAGHTYDDLSNWNNHLSKLYARYKLTPKLSMDGSLIAY